MGKEWKEENIKEPLQFNDWSKITRLIKSNYE